MLQSVKIGGTLSNIAICTLWTPIELVERKLDTKDYAIIGQLYSKDAGLNMILRYCLANKNIRYIIVCGQDRVMSGQALLNLRQKGIDAQHNIVGVQGARIDREIPQEAIERFRQHVEVIDARHITEYGKLNEIIKGLQKKERYGAAETFPEAQMEAPQQFPTDPVFKIRTGTIGEAWLQALNLVLKFGTVKESQHEERQKEVLCLVATITQEDPEHPAWKPYFTFPQQELEEYYPQVLSDQKIPELSYTYGQRMRGHKNKDQIMEMVKNLILTPHTRRAIATTWDVELDTDSKNPPCLNIVQALVQDKKLFLLAYLRSNDIYGAWPKNAFALRKLQQQLCRETGNSMGELIMISASAHIYERHFTQASTILKEYPLDKHLAFDLPRSAGTLDPRGNIHIEVSQGKIRLSHLSLDGTRLEEHTADTAEEAARWLILQQKLSNISHAVYLGQELMKAEIALKKGMEYRQDQGLKQG